MPTAVFATATATPTVLPSIIVITPGADNGSATTETGLKAIYIAGIVVGTTAILVSLLAVLACFLLIRHNRKKGRQWPRYSSSPASNKGSSPISTAETIKVDLEASRKPRRLDTSSTPVNKRSKSRWPNYYRVSPPPHMLLFPFRRSSRSESSPAAARLRASSTTESPLTHLKISSPIPIVDSPLRQHPVHMQSNQHRSKGKSRMDQAPPSPPLRSPLRPPLSDQSASIIKATAKSSKAANLSPKSSSSSLVPKPRRDHSQGAAVPVVPSSSKAHILKKSQKRNTEAVTRVTTKPRSHGHARYDSATDIDMSEDEQMPQTRPSASSSRTRLGVQNQSLEHTGDRSPIFDLKYPEIPQASNVCSSSPHGVLPISSHDYVTGSNTPPAATLDDTATASSSRGHRRKPSRLELPVASSSTSPITPGDFSSVTTRIPTPFAPPPQARIASIPSVPAVPSPATVTGTSLMNYSDPSQHAANLMNRQASTWPGDSSSSSRQHRRDAKGKRARTRHQDHTNGASARSASKATLRRGDLPQSDVYDFF